MPHATPLIATIVGGLVLAFFFGALAFRLRVSPLIGYLAAGIAIGPFTPGFVADQHLADELAELGVILLMFGVGLHFSVKDLMAVRRIAIPGALAQIAAAILLGLGLAHLLDWSLAAGLMFGLALSVASTVVLLRALNERNILDTERGRIAIGWLIVEDLAMVLALVLIPAVASGTADGGAGLAMTLAITIGKVAAFVALMLVVGRRAVPWLLHVVAHSGSRELFRLAVLAIALGVAFGAAALFGVSFALGAFFAGMILAESPLSQRAAEETLPLRDAFAVLFFVSVGMLFNPHVLVEQPWALAATIAIIVVGKSLAAYALVRAFGKSNRTALTIAASLAQIGEFSFILATMGTELKIMPEAARDLVLAGAIFSIMLNPLIFALIDRREAKQEDDDRTTSGAHGAPVQGGHIVVVGHGRVGGRVAAGLLAAGERVTVIEAEADRDNLPENPRATVLTGNGAASSILTRAKVAEARLLFVTVPESFEAGQVAEQARALNPRLRIVARAGGKAAADHLCAHGADRAIIAEEEVARQMVDEALVGR